MFRVLPLIFGLILPCAVAIADEPERKPNVVVFLSDDQGFGDFSFQGNPDIQTPNIDSLARDGALFKTFLVCPVCSPTRAEFLTGRYAGRSGVVSTSAGGERMSLDEQTIAELFSEAGYHTAAFGKWHNGMQYPYHPLGRGFDEFYGFCSGHWGDYFSPPLEHNGVLVRGNGFVTDDFTSRTIEFIEAHQNEPFFVYVPYNTPHSPMQVPDEYWNRFADKEIVARSARPEREDVVHTRAALAMCENIDWNVGRVLKKLDELELADETIVVYFNDNGPNGLRFNCGLRGRKGSTDDGGVRSPLLVRWNGMIEPETEVSQLSAAIDLLPTLCELCELDVRPANTLDGISLRSWLFDPEAPLVDREIVSIWKNSASIRTQDFRLDSADRLYRVAEDPGQQDVVNDEFPEVHSRLSDLLAMRTTQLIPADGFAMTEKAFPVGHPEFPYTWLPARDAKTTGNIRRSNRFPNCSYFTGWTSTEDIIYWPVQVLEQGRYRVEILYTCAESDCGAKIRLEFFDQSVEAVVVQANDPPEAGMENDRSPRIESYVKDFAALDLGVIDLPAAEGNFILRSVEIPGESSIDFSMMILTGIQ